MKNWRNAFKEFWQDDIRRSKALRIAGFVVRCVVVAVIALMMWSWLSIPSDKEHQLYLALALIVLSLGFTAVNIMWYRNK